MSNVKQFLYALGSKCLEGGVFSLTAGGAGYFARQQFIRDYPQIAPDEIVRPPMQYAIYNGAFYCCQILGIKNKILPYVITFGADVLWECLEYTNFFQPVVQTLLLGPNLKGTAIDLSMDAFMLALIFLNSYSATKETEKQINPLSE